MRRLALTFALVAVAAPVLAGTVPKLIPYQGVLEKDGVLVNAIGDDQVAFRVNLYDAETGGNLLWGPQDLDANVYNGRFALVLGPYVHVADTPEYLDIQVQGPGDPDFVPLGGRQRLLSAPYAVAADRADTDFEVPGRLDVTGDGWVGGRHDIDAHLGVGGNAAIGGALFVTGFAVWNCPPGTGRAGNMCMSNIRGPATLTAAANDCHDSGMSLCNLDDIMRCDLLNLPNDGSGDSCGEVTDEPAQGRILFSVNYNNFFEITSSSNVFANLTCFSSNLVGLGENTAWLCNMAESHHYFCCSPVVPNLSKGATQ